TKEVINSIRMGRTANVKKVKRAVQAIVDQVLNNEASLMGLTTLRDYDEYTFTHSVNVCIFSVALGRKLGLTKLQLYDLGMAALFHDVGKSRVPLEVLNKQGGLSDEEWRIMQAHPWLGVLTLFGLRGYGEIPYRGMIVAYEHHMKTDLTGYPKSLRGRDLSIYSKIVAVADGFDAATSRRVYQTVPIQPDQVLKEMWENPRRGYDPVVVKAFINLIGIYPVGTCVILDTYEVAVVHGANPDVTHVHRPMVRVVTTPRARRPRRGRRHCGGDARAARRPRDDALARRRRRDVLGARSRRRPSARTGLRRVQAAGRRAAIALRRRRRRGRPRRRRRRPRGGPRPRRTRGAAAPRRARPGRRCRRARPGPARRGHPRRRCTARPRPAPRPNLRAASRRGGEDAGSTRPPVAGASPRPHRHPRRPRRRLHD